ncbi:unnamed protein product [Diabrotica balteata]|uniref:MADF domain-containing protein n=1 Tax=Diabrotica balteata TaxID=107213 RepID=A0A9N9T653_DIABA|nr:unnamed protein product [Diabrotica balteata]
MDIEIDNELLINLVEQRSVLWDTTLEQYKNRNKTLQDWKEICRILKDGFDEMSEKEQNEIGAAANSLKKYVYYEQLLLKKTANSNKTENSLDDTINQEQVSVDNNTTSTTKKRKLKEPQIQSASKKMMTAFEGRMIAALETPPPPAHQTFTDYKFSL